MTVSSTISKSGPYAGAGTVGPFPITFQFLNDEDIAVIKTENNADIRLVLDVDYVVNGGQGNTGTVVLLSALPAGRKITILRNVMATQETDYIQNDPFPAETHELALDKLTYLVQQLGEENSRALKLAASYTGTALLPPAQGSYLLGFTPDGSGFQAYPPNLAPGDSSSIVYNPGAGPATTVETALRNVDLFRDDLFAEGGADKVGFLGSYSVSDELTKRGLNYNFHLDEFFRYMRTKTDGSRPFYILGDSISEFSNAIDAKNDSYAGIIKKGIQTRYKNGNLGFANFDFDIYDNPAFVSANFTHKCIRSGFTAGASGAAGGNSFYANYFGGTMIKSVTANDYVDCQFVGKEARLVYVQDTVNGAVVEVSYNGVVIGTIDTKLPGDPAISINSPHGVLSAEIPNTLPYGTHTLRIRNTENKTAMLCGVVYLDNAGNCEGVPTVFNVGRSSIALTDIPNTLLDVYSTTGAPLIFALGMNDYLLSRSVTDFETKLDRVVSNVTNASSTCVICDYIVGEPDSNAYKTALRNAAIQYEMPYLDFGRMWLVGVYGSKYINYLDSDNVHPTVEGHEFIANTIMRTIGLPYDKGSAVGYTPGVTNNRVPLTLATSWTGLTSPYDAPRVWKDNAGQCRLTGAMSRGAAVPLNSVIATLPVGYRPAIRQFFTVPCDNSSGTGSSKTSVTLEIRETGEVAILGVGTTGDVNPANNLSFSGIEFSVIL